ncbi:MAG: hypothetical protein RL591_596 [Planctomycetota bacterium]
MICNRSFGMDMLRCGGERSSFSRSPLRRLTPARSMPQRASCEAGCERSSLAAVANRRFAPPPVASAQHRMSSSRKRAKAAVANRRFAPPLVASAQFCHATTRGPSIAGAPCCCMEPGGFAPPSRYVLPIASTSVFVLSISPRSSAHDERQTSASLAVVSFLCGQAALWNQPGF